MKKNLYILSIIFTAFFISCDETEPIVGNDSGQSLLSFNSSTYDLPIEIDNEGSIEVEVNISETASTDRTYNIEVVLDSPSTTADPSTYEVPDSVTIPANSYTGSFTVMGFDNDVTISPETLVLRITGFDGSIVTNEATITTTLSLFQVCPVPANYLIGQYTIEDAVANIGPANDSANFATGTVTISEGSTPTTRVFSAVVLPGIGGANNITLNLSCGEFVLGTVDANISCDGGETPYIYTKAADGGYANSTYDPDGSDESFTITYTEDTQGSCGGPFQASFTLTKIQ